MQRKVEHVIASHPVLTLPPEASVREAALTMTLGHVASVAVADSSGHALEGIFTERDLTERVVANGLDPSSTPLAQVMTAHPEVVTPDTSVRDALRKMYMNDIRHLPVVAADGTVIGMLSMRDFMGQELAELERERELADSLIEVL